MEAVIFENIWKFVFILALMSSGYFFNKYTSRIEKTLEKLTELVNELVSSKKLHEHRLDNHESRIEDIENIKVVKYRK
jgi:hypothetical protein